MSVEVASLLPGVPPVESPLFDRWIERAGLSDAEAAIARSLHNDGYAILDFPDAGFAERSERIKTRLAGHFGIDPVNPMTIPQIRERRVQDAWSFDADVLAIAINEAMLILLHKLYGRKPIPFQTLNFPVGSQQAAHTDSVHFSSLPERFMCGVWVALEDIDADAGPLVYYPGSHKWPILTNALIGRRGWGSSLQSAQTPFEDLWAVLVDATGASPQSFLPRQGQALIWAANLLHGGGAQFNPQRTRWSQVTHYYFEDCIYYTPAFSDESLGLLDLRTITEIGTGATKESRYLDDPVVPSRSGRVRNSALSRLVRFLGPAAKEPEPTFGDVPADFVPSEYLRLNPDVAEAAADAIDHYRRFGRAEGRRYL